MPLLAANGLDLALTQNGLSTLFHLGGDYFYEHKSLSDWIQNNQHHTTFGKEKKVK